MSTYRVSWIEHGRRVPALFCGAGAKAAAEKLFADSAGKPGLRLEQGSKIIDGDRGVRLVRRDGKPQRETVTQGCLWEGEG